MQLRDYQKKAIKEIYKSIAEGRTRVACSLSTGAGKSLLISRIALDAAARNRKTLILVHRKTLLPQLREAILRMSKGTIAPMLVAAGFKAENKDSPIIIAMVQTLERRELPENIGLLMLDEAHITAYFNCFELCLDKYLGKIWALSQLPVIGFSATFWRTNNKEGYCRWFNSKVQGISARGLINQEFLTKPRLFTYDNILNSSELQIDGSGDFSLSSIRRACNNLYLEDCCNKWLEKFSDKKTLFFTSCIEHAKYVKDYLESKGIFSELIQGNSTKKERDRMLGAFRKGKTTALINCGVLTEGYDDPSIECVAILRPSTSVALITQIIGRVLRIHPDKKEAIILDFGECADRVLRNPKTAFPELEDDLFEYNDFTLCPISKGKEKREIPMRTCLHCESEIIAMLRICPHCGAEQPKAIKDSPDTVSFPELVEYMTVSQKETMKQFRKAIRDAFKEDEPTISAMATIYSKKQKVPNFDWGIGSIFQEKYPELNYSFFKWYLTKHLALADNHITNCLSLEFGKYKSTKMFNPSDYLDENNLLESYKAAINAASPGELVMLDKLMQIMRNNQGA